MIEAFLIKPFLALTLITLSCSLLGVFVLWKRLAYFGDGLSHSILLGFILGALFDINQMLALIIFSLLFAILVGLASRNSYFSKDTIIAISSYFCISLAIILNDLFNQNINLGTYVFGDILTVGHQELWSLCIISIVTIIYSIYAFRKILMININADLAKIDGVKVQFWNLSFLILLAITIALSVKIVGILLMTALLILPAAISRIFAISAKQMIIFSLIIGCSISTLSFKLADIYNLAVGSSIISGFCIIFILSLSLKKITSK